MLSGQPELISEANCRLARSPPDPALGLGGPRGAAVQRCMPRRKAELRPRQQQNVVFVFFPPTLFGACVVITSALLYGMKYKSKLGTAFQGKSLQSRDQVLMTNNKRRTFFFWSVIVFRKPCGAKFGRPSQGTHLLQRMRE